MIIREITPTDIETITQMRIQMLDEVTEEPLPAELENQIRRFVWKHMQDNTCLGYLAEVDGNVVADAVIYLFETMPDEVNVKGLTAMLYSVYTRPEFRGQGIMAQILPKVIQLARDAGAIELKMTAEKKAIPLYERMGFHVNDDAMKMRLQAPMQHFASFLRYPDRKGAISMKLKKRRDVKTDSPQDRCRDVLIKIYWDIGWLGKNY